MTQVGSVYGEALYSLALEEALSAQILEEISVLAQSFRAEPDFIRLLCTPNLSVQERCKILDDSFRSKLQLRYFCLENPVDGGAWKAVVHGVAEGWT